MMPPLITVGSMPAGIEHRRDHRRRRRLAVGAGDRDGLLHPHQLGEHFGALDDRQPALDRRFDLGIAARDRGRADDHRRIAEIVGAVADLHRDAGLAQAFDDIAFGNVGALHLIAELVHHLGDPGHADAADADEVDGADVGAERLHAGTPWTAPPVDAADRGRPDFERREPAADPLDEVGEVARGVRAADRQRARGGIGQRLRVGGQRLDLPRQRFGREIASARSSARRPRAVISRALAVWWSSVAAAKGIRIAGRPAAVSSAMVEAPARPITRCASPSLLGHVLDIGHQLGRDAELGIARADASMSSGRHCWTTCRRWRSDGSSSAEPVGHDLAEDASRPGFRR